MTRRPEPSGAKPFKNGLVKVSVQQQTNLTPISNATCVLHAQWGDNANHPIADLSSWLGFFVSTWVAQITPHQSHFWQNVQFIAQSLGGDGVIATQADSTVGGVADVSMPPNTAVCISLRSGITARGGRGRVYIPGIPATNVVATGDPSIIVASANTWKTAMNNIIGALIGHTISGTQLELVVPSYYTHYTLRPVPLVGYVTSAAVNVRLASQRRRLGKERNFQVVA